MKKRTKKLLLLSLGVCFRGLGQTPAVSCKTFFGSFFQKRTIFLSVSGSTFGLQRVLRLALNVFQLSNAGFQRAALFAQQAQAFMHAGQQHFYLRHQRVVGVVQI